MLAADAQLDVRPDGPALLDGDADQLADALAVEGLERVVLVDAQFHVGLEELAAVVAAETAAHLRQVVGAEAEELRLLGDFVCRDRSARHLDHRADLDGEGQPLDPALGHHLGDDL